MKNSTITLTYDIKRSCEFQTVGASASVEVTFEEKDDRKAKITEIQSYLKGLVDPAVERGLQDALRRAGKTPDRGQLHAWEAMGIPWTPLAPSVSQPSVPTMRGKPIVQAGA